MRILHHLNSQKFWLKHDWLGRLTFVFSGASGDFQRTTTIQRTSDWTQVYNDVFMLHSLLQISTESSRVLLRLISTRLSFESWTHLAFDRCSRIGAPVGRKTISFVKIREWYELRVPLNGYDGIQFDMLRQIFCLWRDLTKG